MKILHILLVSLLFAGCTCTMEQAEKLVGACEKQKEIVEGPPEKIYLIMPKISAPEPSVLTCESWTEEMIREDPVGYEEAIWNDLLMLVDHDLTTTDYINRLEAARAKLEAKANENVGGEHG